MDAVYVCRSGYNEELRYSLRSLANLPEIERVWIFGDPPRWVDGSTVNIVRVRQVGNKYENARAGILSATGWPGVSKTFALFNDDFFTMRPTSIPVAHMGPTRDVIARYREILVKDSRYVVKMNETREALVAAGIAEPLCYELHIPMIFEKRALREILLSSCAVAGMLFRSYYGNTVGPAGVEMDDVKVGEASDPIPRGDWLSCNDETFRVVKPLLEEAFPDPGPYETGPDRRVTVGVLI